MLNTNQSINQSINQTTKDYRIGICYFSSKASNIMKPTRGKQFNTMIEMIGDIHVNTHKKTGKHVYVQ
jgi:hypothetical protein